MFNIDFNEAKNKENYERIETHIRIMFYLLQLRGARTPATANITRRTPAIIKEEIMRVSQSFGGYNARRYSKPWIGIVTAWPIGGKPVIRFGRYIGNDRNGGEAEIDAQAGDIARWGQADHRGSKTDNLWGIVQEDGAILSCHEPQARQHWTQRQQAQHDTTAIEIAPMPTQRQDAMTPMQLPSNTPIPLELPRHAEPDATPEPVQAAQPPQQQTITPDIREIDPTAAHYIQSRAQMDFALVDEYAQMMRDGVEFDAAQGVEDATGAIYIYDGYHRGEAAKAAGVTLRVRVQPGTRADADWLAFSANKSHGLRRTRADIERVVKNALAHPNAANMSDRELARHCGTDHKTVGNWRRRLNGEIPRVPTPDAPTQTEIEGTEKPEYTLAEIREVVEDYLPKDATDRASMLNNLISKTAAGQAYEREIVGLLRGNPTRSCERLDASLRIVYGLIIHTLPADNNGGAGLDALTVLQVEHDKIATMLEDTMAIEANAGEADDTPTAPRPVEIEQMRCAGCGAMFLTRELTYNTGLCRTCLDFQLTLLAERQPLIAATFRVLERRLLGGFAAEIKRDIYEEIYAPTPEPEAQAYDPSERVLYHKQQGLSVRKIADALKAEGITLSKSAVDRILQEQKEAE